MSALPNGNTVEGLAAQQGGCERAERQRAAHRVYEFAFIMQPLKAQGFTGSTFAPVAIR